MKRLLANISGEEAPRTGGEDGKKTLEAVSAVVRSCETGRPVDLP